MDEPVGSGGVGGVEDGGAGGPDGLGVAVVDGGRREEADAQLATTTTTTTTVECLPRATAIGLETITLLGGIGYTWEHDTHLYWRRAMTLENLLGPSAAWEYRVGELVQGTSRDFSVDLADTDPAFRKRVAGLHAEVAALPAPRCSTRSADSPSVPAARVGLPRACRPACARRPEMLPRRSRRHRGSTSTTATVVIISRFVSAAT